MQIRRKPYSQSLAQRLKHKGDIFLEAQQSLDCATGGDKKICFYLMQNSYWTSVNGEEACGDVSSWTVWVPCVLAWFRTLSFSLYLYSRSCRSVAASFSRTASPSRTYRPDWTERKPGQCTERQLITETVGLAFRLNVNIVSVESSWCHCSSGQRSLLFVSR